MPQRKNRTVSMKWAALLLLLAPAAAIAGITAQGITAQGITAQGITAQGITAQGTALLGTDLLAADLKGTTIGFVELRGTTSTSPIEEHQLTNIPEASTGTGNYITVGTSSAVGHYAVAHLLDVVGAPAEDLDLYIAAQQDDPVPNLFHRAEAQSNQDELYTVYFFHKWSGQWMSLCPYNPATGSASAMAIPEDPSQPNRFTFACTATGVASKCARNWGYRPWAKTTAWLFDDATNAWVEKQHDLKPYYDACKIAAQAAYCQDGRSYTKDGTLVDLFDTRQIIWPNAVENPFNASNPSSLWMLAQEYFVSFDPSPGMSSMRDSALQRTRYRELSPVGECTNLAYVDRLEHDHLEDGRWASPLTNTPRIQVFSPTYCKHDEGQVGEALPWDCSPCTTEVCKTMPKCCSADSTLSQPVWDAACTTKAAAVCQDGGTPWPKGKVWPPDPSTLPPPIPGKYLLGPAGAVTRVDGISALGSSASVSGWACDPEWSGGVVSVRIYGGAPRELGGTLLGEVRADLALATPLAREVSAACDGPGRDYARHGFSFTLPENLQGNVFVYAIDEATADGAAAPPTLLRNGIVHAPSCAHSEHVTGEALDAACSACAGSVCGDGTHGACCGTDGAWTASCAAAADACAPTSASAPGNSHAFAAVTTGWIEAPVDGTYLFDAAALPSRLFVNGKKVLDWFAGTGTRQGSIELSAGGRYHFRWDRFQAEPPVSTVSSAPGVTWQPPGASALGPIPAGALYALAPGTGTGLRATYHADPAFAGATLVRTDAVVDIGTEIVPPSPIKLPAGIAPGYSVAWEGEIIPLFSEPYDFYVVGSGQATLIVDGQTLVAPGPAPAPPSVAGGCAHNLCQIGDKIAASSPTQLACNPCVDLVCAKDPYCCNGGYLSYYSTEPQWDAKCVAEVKTACGIDCKNPLPTPVSPQKKSSSSIPLVAGARYKIRLAVDNTTSDNTIRLLWASARQHKQVVPQFALYPAGSAATARGAGLNVTVFAGADLATVAAVGATPDLSVAPPVGQNGTPLIDLLAAPSDALAGTPPPPVVVRPRYQEEIFDTVPRVVVKGVGGLTGNWIVLAVDGQPGETVVPVGPGGSFEGTVAVPSFNATWTVLLRQRTYEAAPCAGPGLCAESYPITWPVKVSLATATAAAPVITLPRDPMHSPNPAANVVSVLGKGSNGPVTVTDTGGAGAHVIADSLAVTNGLITGTVTLSDGATDPSMGWHKLTFSQGGAPSNPVFVSVGIRPPTVEFPRTGAAIDCKQPDQPSRNRTALGTIPYPIERFGRLRVMEETGRPALNFVNAETRYVTPQQPGDPIVFVTSYAPSYGKHLIYFFQAPDPPANATPEEVAAHYRAFASVADTPTSRIELDIPPPRFTIDRVTAAMLQKSPNGTSLHVDVRNCQTGVGTACALPNADVNVRIGPRLFTSRADGNGNWLLDAPLDLGWNDVTLSQVVDSRSGGAWRESCPSDTVSVGGNSSSTVVLTVPGNITVDATSPKGAAVTYTVTAQSTRGNPVAIECVPPSGAIFPVGGTFVRCTGIDKTTGEVGLAGFEVTVLDGPPVIQYPKDGITAEATSALGAMVSYDVTASDAVSGQVPVDCAPASPAQFPVDAEMPVTCEATDPAGSKAVARFLVRVRDTTPPMLCGLPDITVGSTSSGGANVSFSTCASDLVDGAVSVTCDHPSGSFFAIGKTVVGCWAVDAHGNEAPRQRFTVTVGDATPPVLKLPGTLTVLATSRSGAKVSYVVTASDNVDPRPTVVCSPPSGSVFPLGPTPVKCTATDAAGNQSRGSFLVKVILSWGGFVLPPDGARYPFKLPLPVVFSVVGPSAGISDLSAQLFVAPVDAAGNIGPERLAIKMPPGTGTLFDFIPILKVYLFTLDTRPLAPGVWQLRADLGDGEVHSTRITLVR